ncbi:pancreatic triacylglycerol lipase-like [Orussus abietinus]|uniref:pancreatic triacylglycerol lipase-like n=1 Tax=Orussus abietinus TaxID=222816 RepID=UPI00062601EC|nr:pancreatic triacylglycerol lipase-like [Orussus abietinus]
MKVLVLAGFLLFIVALAHPAAIDSAKGNEEDKIENDIEGFDDDFYDDFDDEVEISVGSNTDGLWFLDDDGNPVEASLDDDHEDETPDQTERDLATRVIFYMYAKGNTRDPHKLYIGDKEALRKSNFDPSKPTRFITHGWMNSRRSEACTLVRDAYLTNGHYNVIVVDWSRITIRPYVFASRRVKMVGIFVSKMIDFLERNGMDPSTTTLVGHSLGAHVMGLAGHYAKSRVDYVVGLDPALPLFTFAGPGSRISKGDARFVEIIHTNAGLLGYLSPIGDVDFYPNGGSKQRGCIIDIGGSCSHSRSYWFFAESINSHTGFYGRECKSYVRFKLGLCNRKGLGLMGGHRWLHSLKSAGTYFLNTRIKFPYAVGK